MEHPTQDELFAYLDRTAPKESAQQVRDHLRKCAQCATELAGWRRTIQRLESHNWPGPEAARRGWPEREFKWVAAAAIILILGFGLGYRAWRPSTGELRQRLEEEMRADLMSAIANGAAKDPFQRRLRQELDSVFQDALNNAKADQRRHFEERIQAVEAREGENQRKLLALIGRVQQQQNADYLSLRHDLETAVSVADSDLKLNRQSLNQLAATLFANTQK